MFGEADIIKTLQLTPGVPRGTERKLQLRYVYIMQWWNVVKIYSW